MVSLNDRWFKWNENQELEEIRIVRIQNENLCSIKYIKGPKTGKVQKIETSIITDTFDKLRPDGYINFSGVSTGEKTTDVMVTINTHKDILNGEKLPYAVCRQGAIDLFAKQLSPDNIDYVGISISRDTCPADVDFSNFFACDGIIYSETMSFYIGDKLSDCLSIIKKKKHFNDILRDNFDKHCMYLAKGNKYIADTYKHRDEVDGYCKDLDTLLGLNNFEYDLYSAFGIISTNLDKEEFSEKTLSNLAMDVLGGILRVEIGKSLVIDYDKDIDFSKIKRNYCLVADKDNKVYVVAYTIVGKYIVPIEETETEENIDKLHKILPAESLNLAYQHLKFSSEKYKK